MGGRNRNAGFKHTSLTAAASAKSNTSISIGMTVPDSVITERVITADL